MTLRDETLLRSLDAIRTLRARVARLEEAGSEPVAIVGVGCRMPPQLEGPDAFWHFLVQGADAVRAPPPNRTELHIPQRPDPDGTDGPFRRNGAYLTSIDRFDAAFFGLAPREAVALDPQQRLLLETAYDALEDAGMALEGVAGTDAGVFVGAGVEDFAQLTLRSERATSSSAYAFTGSDLSLAAGRIAYCFDLRGPAMVVDTACSSSLVAVHLATQSLRRGETSLALVGGVNLVLDWDIGVSLCSARALAPDGRCKTFDAAADGYGRGEGCVVLVLKRWADAVRDGDHTLALLLGSAVNQDGASSGLTAPNGLAQTAVIRRALRDAGVEPRDVDYVEAHGTGTPLGDPIEVDALAAALSPGRDARSPLWLGLVKTQLGHLEAAAGLAGLLKVALALGREQLPPTIHQQALNPQIDLAAIPAEIVKQARPWPRKVGRRRVAGVSSFGISGTNVHVVIGEAPARVFEQRGATGLTTSAYGTVLVLSARSEAALRELSATTGAWLRGASPAEVDDACHEAAQRRSHHPLRVAASGRRPDELAVAFEAHARGEPLPPGSAAGRAGEQAGPVFVFSGQGGQWHGMGRCLLRHSPAARRAIAEFDCVLGRYAGWSVEACLGRQTDEGLTGSDRAQPTLCALQIALAEHWASWGVSPSALVGHSAGEVAAAYVAGALDMDGAVRVALHRGRLMQRLAGTGAMAVVDAAASDFEARLESHREVAIAALNAPEMTVVSGTKRGVQALLDELRGEGIEARSIAVELPAHGPWMDPILDELCESLSGLQARTPSIPLWSTVTGAQLRGPECNGGYWARNVRQVVRFATVMGELLRRGERSFVEIGPHSVLAVPIAQCATHAGSTVDVLASMRRDGDDMRVLLGSLAGLYVQGEKLDGQRLFGAKARTAARLPPYPWQRERYWPDPPASVEAPTRWRRATPRGAPTTVRSGLVHRVSWETDTSASRDGPVPSARWTVIADAAGLGRALAREMTKRGLDVTLHEPGLARGPVFRDAPLPEDALLGVLDGDPAGPTPQAVYLVLLTPLDQQRHDGMVADVALDGAASAWRWGAQVVRASARARGHLPRRLWVVTRGAQRAAGRGGEDPVQAAASAMWGSIAFEAEELRLCRVDLDPALDFEDDIASLLDELLGGHSVVDSVARRGTARLLPRLEPGTEPTRSVALRPDGSYLITGGLGALGLTLADALVEGSAGHVALLGRHVVGAGVEARIERLRATRTKVSVHAIDVTDRDALALTLDTFLRDAPPLRGVFHAAGVLHDGVMLAQQEAQFRRVAAPKLGGACNLHAATAGHPLDFFVLFSSIAGTLCPPGQASYAAANAALDAIARRRHASGLPATSVAWGPWAEGGMVGALSARHRTALAQRGLDALDPATGRQLALGLPSTDQAHVLAMPLENREALARSFTFADGRPAAIVAAMAAAPPGTERRSDLPTRLRESPATLRLQILTDEVSRHVGAALGTTRVPGDVAFRQLGMDSLMALRIRNALSESLRRQLPASLLLDSPTVDALARSLAAEAPAPCPRPPEPSVSDTAAQVADDLELLASLAVSGASQDLLDVLQTTTRKHP